MVASNSRLAYADCFGILEQAIADSKGIRVRFASVEQAKLFRLRLHNARKIDRKENTVIHGEDHQMAGKSIYDGLVMRIRSDRDQCWLRVEKLDAMVYDVESLSEPVMVPQQQPEPMKRRI